MSVHVGFLDGQGRAYDLAFRTTRRRFRDPEGEWELEPGEAVSAETSLEASLFVQRERQHLLMRPTSGAAVATDRRLVFVAGDAVERTAEEPTTFNVAIRVPQTAVDHLLRQAGGREVVEVRREEVREVLESRAELTLRIEAPWIGGPGVATFQLVLGPANAARRAIAPLGL